MPQLDFYFFFINSFSLIFIFFLFYYVLLYFYFPLQFFQLYYIRTSLFFFNRAIIWKTLDKNNVFQFSNLFILSLNSFFFLEFKLLLKKNFLL